MDPENVVAALGILCGQGSLQVRVADEWVEIRTEILNPGDPDRVEREVLDTSDLFLLLMAEEAK